jgi:aspartyl-tRNA(Asn)/glutamyl-tRNA(Gln) amidotransferase subunit A
VSSAGPPDPDDLAFASVAEAGRLLRAGRVSSQSLTDLMLERTERLDGRLNAFVTVTGSQAREAARAADAELAAGRDRGPLHGIPVAVKDLFATAGVRTTGGSRLYESWVPEADANAVDRLRRAGAVILGKTGMHELAFGTTSINPVFGAIANPWRLDHHPGGSSGGSAVAVAAGLAYAALGTDTGCSVRQPAHCCGIVGLKPSFGLVGKSGVLPLAWTLDHVGPMTRDVGDAALVLAAIAGPDSNDPYSAGRSFEPSLDDLDRPIRGATIGVPRRFFFEGGQRDVVAIVEAALERFRALGATLVEVELAGVEEASAAAGLTFAEAGAIYREALHLRPKAFSDELHRKLERQLRVSGPDYAAAQHLRRRFTARCEQLMQTCDVLALPTANIAASPIATVPSEHGLYSWRNTGIFNFTGQPAISVPCGLTSASLPVGLMLVGHLFDDAAVLRFARAFELTDGWRRRRPLELVAHPSGTSS